MCQPGGRSWLSDLYCCHCPVLLLSSAVVVHRSRHRETFLMSHLQPPNRVKGFSRVSAPQMVSGGVEA